jgi:hypothetical protein
LNRGRFARRVDVDKAEGLPAMSEYQYYEFAAIDRPLTRDEQAELRAISTRALITPASFVNTYQWVI